MEGKLIKTEFGYYLVDNSEIKFDEYYLAWETNHEKPKWVRYVLCSGLNGQKQFKIIASTIDLDKCQKLSIENCQAIEQGYDLNELAENHYHISNFNVGNNRDAFRKGFQKALEILGDKKFSKEDMIKAYEEGLEDAIDLGKPKDLKNQFIQSLQQTAWLVSFDLSTKNKYGCLILKRI